MKSLLITLLFLTCVHSLHANNLELCGKLQPNPEEYSNYSYLLKEQDSETLTAITVTDASTIQTIQDIGEMYTSIISKICFKNCTLEENKYLYQEKEISNHSCEKWSEIIFSLENSVIPNSPF